MSTTHETRRESYLGILPSLPTRQEAILTELKTFPEGATAGELALHMWDNNYFPLPERNAVHPRLNELIKLDLVKVDGKRKCGITGRNCTVYLVKEETNNEVK